MSHKFTIFSEFYNRVLKCSPVLQDMKPLVLANQIAEAAVQYMRTHDFSSLKQRVINLERGIKKQDTLLDEQTATIGGLRKFDANFAPTVPGQEWVKRLEARVQQLEQHVSSLVGTTPSKRRVEQLEATSAMDRLRITNLASRVSGHAMRINDAVKSVESTNSVLARLKNASNTQELRIEGLASRANWNSIGPRMKSTPVYQIDRLLEIEKAARKAHNVWMKHEEMDDLGVALDASATPEFTHRRSVWGKLG